MPDSSPYRFTVFTKPWKLDLPELGAKVRALGFDGVELPVRSGYAVNPENVTKELPKAARFLREEFGLTMETIASATDEKTIRACADAGILLVRTMGNLRAGENYLAGQERLWREWDALLPLLSETGVTIGVQNHQGRFVGVNGAGLHLLLQRYDPKHIAAVWDAAHNALEGEAPELALDLVGAHLRVLNFKNALRVRQTGPEAADVLWKTYWTSGRQGFASWPRVAQEVVRRGWGGVVCLSAEYSDEPSVDRLIAEDIVYARQCFAEAQEKRDERL